MILRKEYFRKVNPRAGVFRWIAFGLYLPFFAIAGVVGYNFYLFFVNWQVNWFMFMTWNYTYMLCGSLIACLIMSGENGFNKWLWKDKNILSEEWKKTKLLKIITVKSGAAAGQS